MKAFVVFIFSFFSFFVISEFFIYKITRSEDEIKREIFSECVDDSECCKKWRGKEVSRYERKGVIAEVTRNSFLSDSNFQSIENVVDYAVDVSNENFHFTAYLKSDEPWSSFVHVENKRNSNSIEIGTDGRFWGCTNFLSSLFLHREKPKGNL